MKISCIADTHRTFPIPESAEFLIHAGDYSMMGRAYRHELVVLNAELSKFVAYLKTVKKDFDEVIFVPGNHDLIFETFQPWARNELEDLGVHVLINESITLKGLNFYGSPVTPVFNDWAFNFDFKKRKQVFAGIPDNTDVVICHGPPYGIRDFVEGVGHCGCSALGDRVNEIRPKLCVFGHIHEGYGVTKHPETTYVNCSIMDGTYQPINKPISVDVSVH